MYKWNIGLFHLHTYQILSSIFYFVQRTFFFEKLPFFRIYSTRYFLLNIKKCFNKISIVHANVCNVKNNDNLPGICREWDFY